MLSSASDHYLAIGDVLEAGGLPGPTDAWTTLADRPRHHDGPPRHARHVGHVPARRPARHLGRRGRPDVRRPCRARPGAGWYEREHGANVVPFPSHGERFERLEDQLAISTGRWATPVGTPFCYEGPHITVMDSPPLPKPVHDRWVPIVIGGGGPQRTPALAARYGAEYNLPFAPIGRFDEQKELVAAACVDVDRDPSSITYTAAQVVRVGADDAEVVRRARRYRAPARRCPATASPGRPTRCARRWSDGPKPAPSGCTCRCSTSPTSTTSTPSPIWSAEAGPRRAEAAEARWPRRVS